MKTAIIATPGGPEVHTLPVVVDEARKVGMPVFTHAVTVEDALAAVKAHPTVLAHTPHIGLSPTNARLLTAPSMHRGIPYKIRPRIEIHISR